MPARRELAGLAGLTLVACLLRFWDLSGQSFDFDEAYTVGVVLGDSLGHALDTIPKTESTPPFYYVLAWAWSQPFGLGEAGIRSLSAVLGTLLVPASFFAGRELVSARMGLVAAALVAVNPLLIFYSQEARTYALFALLVTLSFWAFLVCRRSPTRGHLALWALASAGALVSHYFAVFAVAPEALALLALPPRRRPAIAIAAVAAVGAALIPLLTRQGDARSEWISDFALSERLKEVAKKPLTGEFDPTANWQLTLLGLLLGAAAGYGLVVASSRERRGFLVALGLAASLVVLPLALDLVGRDYLNAKNVLPAVPLAVLALAATLAARRSGWVGVAATAAACAFFVGVVIIQAREQRYQRPDYRAVARDLGRPASTAAVLTPYEGSQPLELYAGAVQAGATAVTDLDVVLPLTRGDLEGPARAPTQPPPPGFELIERVERPDYSRVRYSSDRPVELSAETLSGLAPGTPTFPPVLLVWPPAGV